MYFSKKLKRFKNINHCFFSRKGGFSKGIYESLNCGIGSKDKKENVNKNLKIVANKMNVPLNNLILIVFFKLWNEASQPRLSSNSFIVWTSDKSGTLFKLNAWSLSKESGIRVKHEFFAPAMGILPDSFFPPSMKIFSFKWTPANLICFLLFLI